MMLVGTAQRCPASSVSTALKKNQAIACLPMEQEMQVREAQIPRELNSGTIGSWCSYQYLQLKNVVYVE